MYFVNKTIIVTSETENPLPAPEEPKEKTPVGISTEKFAEILMEKLPERLPENLKGGNILIKDIRKANYCYTGLIVEGKGKTAPVVDLDSLMEEHWYESVDQLIDRVVELLEKKPPFEDIPDFSNYEEVKDRLFVRVQGIKNNEKLLELVPWRKAEDLAITASILVSEDMGSLSSCTVHNEMVKEWGMDPEEVLDQALKNSPKVFSARFQSFAEIAGVPEDNLPGSIKMYVLTNRSGVNGAAAMFYEGVLDHASEVVGGDIIILPSSIHEVIIIPADMDRLEEYQRMVRSINNEVVADEEKLTDSVYGYDKEHHRVVLLKTEAGGTAK